MTASFEFLTVLYALIIGVGVFQMLISVGTTIQAHENARLYWVHSAWAVFIFGLHAFVWFGVWEYRDLAEWPFSHFLLFISVPVLLCLLSILTFPDVYAGKSYDYRAYYYTNCRWILGLVALTVTMVAINERVLLDQPFVQLKNLLRAVVVILVAASAMSRNPLLHGLVIGAMYLIMGVFVVTYRGVIS